VLTDGLDHGELVAILRAEVFPPSGAADLCLGVAECRRLEVGQGGSRSLVDPVRGDAVVVVSRKLALQALRVAAGRVLYVDVSLVVAGLKPT
jgi:hypothetical protein